MVSQYLDCLGIICPSLEMVLICSSFITVETVLTHLIVTPNTITVMWNALPLTEYCVDITRTTLDFTETVVLDSLCGFTNEYIFMYSDNSVCARFTVTPTDGEMRGTTSELCTGLFTRVEGVFIP